MSTTNSPGLDAADTTKAEPAFCDRQETFAEALMHYVAFVMVHFAAGLDSLGAVELRNSLEGSLHMQLPGTLVFDYPSTAALVDYLQRVVRCDEILA